MAVNTHNWTGLELPYTLASAGLNNLANDDLVAGTQVTGNDKLSGFVEVVLASVDLSAQTNPAIYIWWLLEADGTNTEDGGASVTPAKSPNVIVPLRAVNGAQRVGLMLPLFTLPPADFTPLVQNKAGAALAASGNTVKLTRFSTETNTP